MPITNLMGQEGKLLFPRYLSTYGKLPMTYLFDPMDGSIRGDGIRKYQKVRGMAFFYDAEDNLSVTVGYTHYEMPNVRRSELEKTLAWFASAPDEEIEKYRVRKKL